MSNIDHRNLSIPLFILGSALLAAGIIGLVVEAATDLDTNNPAGAAGAGAVLLFASVAVTILLNPASDAALAPVRTLPPVFGVVLAVLLASGAGATMLADTHAPAAAHDDATAQGADAAANAAALLGTEDFSGSLQGAMTGTPLGGLGGTGATSAAHDLTIPDATRGARIELHWSAGTPGGAGTLSARIENAQGETLADATGASPLVLDLDALDAGELRLVVSLPEGAASTGQAYDAYASYFAGAIPAGYTAHA